MSRKDDQLEVTARVADLARAGLPLEPGLRALAEESPSRRIRRVLLSVCGRLERGESIEHVLAVPDSGMPLHVSGLLAAGVRTGRLPDLLSRYLDQSRRWQDLRRRAWGALLYPALLLLCAIGVLGFYLVWLVPEFKRIFEDFDTELPSLTIVLIDVSQFVVKYLGLVLVGIPALVLGIAAMTIAIGGRANWHRAMSLIPLVGSMFRYTALAELCHLLALLLRHEMPLPDALRMAAAGTSDADLAVSAREMARLAETGRRIEFADFGALHLPILLRGSFRWEGEADALSDSLDATGEVFASLAASRATLLRGITGPVVIVVTAVAVGSFIVVLFSPLVKLLNDLS